MPLRKVTTVSTIVPVPESRTVVQAASVERSSARQHVDDARKDVLIIRKNSVQTMKSHRLYVKYLSLIHHQGKL